MTLPANVLESRAAIVALVGAILIGVAPISPRRANAPPVPKFVAHEIATGLTGGYQVIAADLNRDGRPDLIAVATGLQTLTWYENPSWTPHVLATGLRAPINAAAHDVDGDGIPEIALAYGF